MSKQSEWQARQRVQGRCVDCGEPAEGKDDGTCFARCPVCLEKQRYRQWLARGRGRRFREWECPLHPGRAPITSKLRTAEYYCGVRLTDGSRCQMSNTDETDAEAAVRLATATATAGELNGEIQGWQCSQHPDAVPRPANTQDIGTAPCVSTAATRSRVTTAASPVLKKPVSKRLRVA